VPSLHTACLALSITCLPLILDMVPPNITALPVILFSTHTCQCPCHLPFTTAFFPPPLARALPPPCALCTTAISCTFTHPCSCAMHPFCLPSLPFTCTFLHTVKQTFILYFGPLLLAAARHHLGQYQRLLRRYVRSHLVRRGTALLTTYSIPARTHTRKATRPPRVFSTAA